MLKFSKNFLALAAAVSLSGCMTRNFAEPAPSLSTSASGDAITVEATAEEGSQTVYDLTVTANQSWGCTVAGPDGKPVDWLVVGTDEYTNLNGVSEEYLVRLFIQNNPINQSRSAQLKLTTHDCEKVISLVQKALTYSLDTSTPKAVSVSCAAETVVVSVVCNTEWTASIKSDATASATLDRSGGYGDDDISVTFQPNNDVSGTKTATLVLSAEDCADVEVVFTQDKCVPNITIDTEKTPATVKYSDKSARIYFKANMDWEASLGGTLLNAALSKTEGTSADTYIDLSFDSKSVWNDLSATVTLKLKGEDKSDSITITQTGGMYIYIPFNTDDSALWTPNLPTTLKKNLMKGPYTYNPNGFTLEFGSTNAGGFGFYQKNGLCFDLDGKTVSWMKIPCPADATVKTVEINCLNTSNKNFTIYDSVSDDGKAGTVLGAALTLNNKSGSWGVSSDWTKAPEKGQAVYILTSNQKNCMIDHLTVTFE